MAFTNHEWSRDLGRYISTHLLITPMLTSTCFALTHPSATLLRSRFYPSATIIDANWPAHGEADWAVAAALFVAWYDENGLTTIPDPQDTDPRIIATARLTPHYYPSATVPATTQYVVWDTDGVVVESFAQRKPNPATLTAPAVFSAIQVTDVNGYYYLTHPTLTCELKTYAESLYGWS